MGQLGATFLIFALGLNVSLHQLCNRAEILKAVGQTLVLALCCHIVLRTVPITGTATLTAAQSLFVGAVVSLSSNFFQTKNADQKDRTMFSTNQALVLASSLVLLSGYQLKMDTGREFSVFAPVLLRLLGLLSMLTVSWFCWPRSLEKLDRSGHQDLFLLGLIGFCIIFTITTQLLVSSGSIGALLSGMLIKQSRDHSTKRLTDIVMEKFYPIQQMLSALFFASLGEIFCDSYLLCACFHQYG